jgi:hypothetical protein
VKNVIFICLLHLFNQLNLSIADIDTGSIENPMAQSMLDNEQFHKLVDCFYFEHHVFLQELAGAWGKSMQGSVLDSLQMFSEMRKKGIAAHYWP